MVNTPRTSVTLYMRREWSLSSRSSILSSHLCGFYFYDSKTYKFLFLVKLRLLICNHNAHDSTRMLQAPTCVLLVRSSIVLGSAPTCVLAARLTSPFPVFTCLSFALLRKCSCMQKSHQTFVRRCQHRLKPLHHWSRCAHTARLYSLHSILLWTRGTDKVLWCFQTHEKILVSELSHHDLTSSLGVLITFFR